MNKKNEIFDLSKKFFIRIIQASETKRVEGKFNELNQLVDKFIDELYKEWANNVSEASKFNLNQYLITRNPKTAVIQLNFHPQVYIYIIY